MAFAGSASVSFVALEFRKESEAQECAEAFAEAFPAYRVHKPSADTIIVKSSAVNKLSAVAKERGAKFRQVPVTLAGDLPKGKRRRIPGFRPGSQLATREGLAAALAELEKTTF